jgi:flagellar hook-associated protein 3 FlgL
MRVTFDMTMRNGVHDILRASEALLRAQREVSSGRRVHVPSDDPSAASRIIGEYGELRAIDSYARVTDSAESRLLVADSMLSDIIRRIEDAQTSAAAAANSFLTQTQRDALALELEGIRDAVLSAVNQQFKGTYIFSGTSATTAPYVKDAAGHVGAYQGNTERQMLDVDRSRAVEVTFDGSSVVGDLFDGFQQLIDAVRAGNTSGPGFSVRDGMARLDEAFTRATTQQSRVGAALRAVAEQRTRLSDTKQASLARRSSLEDVNLAEAIARMRQAELAHQAAIGAVGVASRQSLLDYLS